MGKKKTGKSAEDLVLSVSPGSVVYEREGDSERVIADLREMGETFVVARGGIGGLGNVHFASSTNQAPREFTHGKPGEAKELRLELRLIADVGIVGLPNAGKSTFLARVSAARPKIADYAFTTLEPNLGVADIDGYRFVLADIPGLIEGAAKGKGLGHAFLKHILRTRVLVHLVSALEPKPLEAYSTVRDELLAYDPTLADRPEIVVVSKVELISDKEQRKLWQTMQKHDPIFLSSVTGRGVNDLLYAIKQLLEMDAE
jgi:GTPase